MRRILLVALAALVLTGATAPPKKVDVDLINPLYVDGMIKTVEGGVITGEDLRIQANMIEYVKRSNAHKVSAKGNLMVEYAGRYYVGDAVEYDFLTQTGRVMNGRTNVNLWYMGGEYIELLPDRTFKIHKPYVTTSETFDRIFDIQARSATITPDNYAHVEKAAFRISNFPVLALPSYRTNLKPMVDTPVTYAVYWDKGQGPRLSMRYRIYSWEDLSVAARFDFRPDFQKVGVSGALSGSYDPKATDTYFVTRNFVQRDTFFNDDVPGDERFRFRAQGLWKAQSEDKRSYFKSQWDWFNDKNLPLTFLMSEFQLNTALKTEMTARTRGDHAWVSSYLRPRINSFQGFKQELPSLDLSLRPISLGKFVLENSVRGSFYDYVYSDDIRGLLPDFNALRLEMDNNIYRSFHTRYFSFTPLAGFTGIYYNDSPTLSNVGQAIFRYQGLLNTKFQGVRNNYTHSIEPYLNFKGLTRPTIRVDDTYIFGLADGYNRLNQLSIGLKNDLFKSCLLMPTLSVDLYGIAFFGANTYKLLIPKTYGDILWNLDRLRFGAHLAWNQEESVLDYSNLSVLWTLSENAALYTEFRHRSRFDWRKDNHNNYILDVTRPIDSLVNTPISDGRNTFLTRFQFKVHPEWILRSEIHLGWGRRNQPGFNEGRIDVLHALATSWRLRASMGWTVRTKFPTGFSGSLNLSNQF